MWDLVLTPFYLLALVAWARRIRDKRYPRGHALRKYYLPGLYVKFGGAVFIALIYQFYYGGGDTFNYFTFSKIVNSSANESLDTWFGLITRSSYEENPYLYKYSQAIEFYTDPSSYSVVAISALLGVVTFNTYIPTALLFAFVSYSGIWAMYRSFQRTFPHLTKELAYAFLFVPSVFVWGSAVFKDTICMFGLGWMTYTTFRIFVDRDFSVKNIFLLCFSFYLIAVIKIYILMAFLPGLMLWLLLTYADRIKTRALRITVGLVMLGVVALGFAFVSRTFAAELKRYSLEEITNTVEVTRGWITYSSGDEGAAYDLGKFDPSVTGVLSKLPAGVVVTLFRPFLWEVKKPIQLLSSLEGLAFILLTGAVFYRNGILRTFRAVFSSPSLIFLFTYAIIFAFAVGISTGNFGALSRYKIPCLPFFAALLLILYRTPLGPGTRNWLKEKAPRRVSEVA